MSNTTSDSTKLFDSIKNGDSATVRKILTDNRSLLTAKAKVDVAWDPAVEMDVYKFLGAYIGNITPLQYALIVGQDSIAKDLIDMSFSEDLDIPMGGGNTALHIASILGASDVVKALGERGANPNLKNGKGFSPLDLVDDMESSLVFSEKSEEGDDE